MAVKKQPAKKKTTAPKPGQLRAGGYVLGQRSKPGVKAPGWRLAKKPAQTESENEKQEE